MKRRNFIKQSAALGAGALTLGAFPHQLYASDKKLYAHDKVKLGNTGIEMSRMAVGTGTSGWRGGSNQTRQLGIKGLADLLRAAYDEGINFWDSADQYGTHPHLKEAQKKIKRENVVIMSKSTSITAEGMKKDLDRFRKEIGTDYLDIVLLHAVTNGNWRTDLRGAMDVLAQAKEDGIIRSHGISCHSIEALEQAAEEPWVDVDLARYNPAGVRMDADVATVTRVLKKMKDNGKGIIGMKVYGAGSLIEKKDECLQFHTGNDFIDSFTLGIESIEQLNDVVKRLPEASIRA
ncbi:MAG: aldo/keto reductase [Bacteroidales bacterium]|jgi:aryl-alcohol dehydrogenase-like predicted oxidoreductase|nr:aldo/keto reductase [Bacteroidales bacterium]